MSTEVIHVRVPAADMQAYRETCKDHYHRDHNDLLREMIKAASERRIRIIPTEGQSNQYEELYS